MQYKTINNLTWYLEEEIDIFAISFITQTNFPYSIMELLCDRRTGEEKSDRVKSALGPVIGRQPDHVSQSTEDRQQQA